MPLIERLPTFQANRSLKVSSSSMQVTAVVHATCNPDIWQKECLSIIVQAEKQRGRLGRDLDMPVAVSDLSCQRLFAQCVF